MTGLVNYDIHKNLQKKQKFLFRRFISTRVSVNRYFNMYLISENFVYINGKHGKYDRTVKNVDVRYGRNANDNYKSYIRDLGNRGKSIPLEFEYKYMPDGKFNRLALLGSAYEELGQHTKIDKSILNRQLSVQGLSSYSVSAMDINNDGYIDVSE